MKLSDDSTHFKCAGCGKLKLVKEVNKAKVAYNVYDKDSAERFCYLSYYVMLCDKCLECKEEGEKENDGNNNSGS